MTIFFHSVVKSNSFVRFLEETAALKNHFDFVWPLITMYIYGLYLTLQTRKRKIFLPIICELLGKDVWSLFALSNSQSKVFWYDPQKEGLLFNTCVPKYVPMRIAYVIRTPNMNEWKSWIIFLLSIFSLDL